MKTEMIRNKLIYIGFILPMMVVFLLLVSNRRLLPQRNSPLTAKGC